MFFRWKTAKNSNRKTILLQKQFFYLLLHHLSGGREVRGSSETFTHVRAHIHVAIFIFMKTQWDKNTTHFFDLCTPPPPRWLYSGTGEEGGGDSFIEVIFGELPSRPIYKNPSFLPFVAVISFSDFLPSFYVHQFMRKAEIGKTRRRKWCFETWMWAVSGCSS